MSVYRKRRESEATSPIIRRIVRDFKRDWRGFIRVEVTDDLNGAIDSVVRKHPLRGFDGTHLATSLTMQERLPEDLLFLCFDEKLNLAAQREGLGIWLSEYS